MKILFESKWLDIVWWHAVWEREWAWDRQMACLTVWFVSFYFWKLQQ